MSILSGQPFWSPTVDHLLLPFGASLPGLAGPVLHAVLCPQNGLAQLISWVVLVAFGSLLGSRWVPMSFCIALTVLEGMFCLGMIWRMDPFRMPRSFCVAQAILIHVSTYVLTGLSMAFCIATNFHILRPKTWANLEQSLRWRKVYPATISVVQIALNLHFDAIQPTDEMHCDASDPLSASRRSIFRILPIVLPVPRVGRRSVKGIAT
ncbi:hypothetical protein B0H15DRAFT_963235 [Mycena belliarum]|uniref:Uncharacterized protein n=1 Tax=Mycena belliarum TaxID=1033014 RepID=A0AAD6UH53_9AGAR|nr:hypothetical protein B0H15DRAFT_963235 [Mycena belliae]